MAAQSSHRPGGTWTPDRSIIMKAKATPTKCHAINLPHPGAYAKAWRRVKSAPASARFNVSWDRPNTPRDEVLKEFHDALQQRINIRGGNLKACEPVPIGLIRDAKRLDEIKTQRIRHYQFETKKMQTKFGHLLARYDD
jgi:hypothetical protein